MDDRAVPQELTPRRRVARLAAAVAVTAGLGVLIVLAVPFASVAAALDRLDPVWLAPLLAAYALGFVARAGRFRALGVELSLPVLVGVSGIHQFLNRVLPLRTGELAFPVLVRRLSGAPFVQGLALVVLCRLLDLVFVVVSFLAALLAVPAARAAVGTTGTVLIAALLPVLLAAYLFLPPLAGFAARRLAVRLAVRRPGWSERLTRAAGVLDEVRRVSRRAFAGAAVWTVLQWVPTAVACWCAVAALGVALGPAEVVVGSTLAVLASVVPLPGVGSFGTLEAGWTAGFVLVGVPAGAAVASALVLSGATFVAAGVLAVVAWAAFSRRRSPAPGAR
ncbi:MAG: flippase-like domain-containing protein [Deltaproteobacteria bacterium]|nr:flippase-like domain-containing protein [Deltaproteobacteria bacterium]